MDRTQAWVGQFNKLLAQHEDPADMAQDRLALLHLRNDSERRILPILNRTMKAVDNDLVEVFRKLVSGQIEWPLFVHGEVGSGKTRAALCLCDFADSAAYWSIDRLASIEIGSDDELKYQTWRDVERKALVVVDEIGQREKVGDLHSSTLQRFMDNRENQSHAIAVYISNVPPEELSGIYDDRIVSRLLAGTVFHLDGDDRRVK